MEFEQHIFENEGCSIHYWVRKGTANKWIVLLHGAGVDHRMFDEQVKCLPSEDNLLLWDARAQGLSRPSGKKYTMKLVVSDLLALLEACGIEKAVFIGQSMGGNIAQEIAYYYPEKITALVLIDCTRNTGKLTAVEKAALALSRPMFALYPWHILVKQSANACGLKQNVRDYIAECFYALGKDSFVDILMEGTKCLHEDREYRIPKPFLLLCGDSDSSGNIRKIAKSWADSEPFCTFHMINHAGHNSNQDNAEEVNKYLLEFLKKIDE